MPATEKPWRDQKLLHVVFGATAFVLLVATIWMFAADHSREWKVYQRLARSIDLRLNAWRLAAQQAGEQKRIVNDLTAQLVAARTTVPSEDLLVQFTESAGELAPKDAASRLDELRSELQIASTAAETARQEVTRLQAEITQLASSNAEQATLEQKQRELTKLGDLADEKNSRAVELRERLNKWLDASINEAKFLENTRLTKRKMETAQYDQLRSYLDLAIRDNRPAQELEALQKPVADQRDAVTRATDAYQAAATRRNELQRLYNDMMAAEAHIEKQLTNARAESDRLAMVLDEDQISYFQSSFPYLGKKWLTLPILDAFNSPLKIENLWKDNLKIVNGSFGSVRRFDHCTTCHQAIEKTQPGSAVVPGFVHEHHVVLSLSTPAQRPSAEADLPQAYGLGLASEGLVDRNAVTIRYVAPQSLAATAAVVGSNDELSAGLSVGDVLVSINGDKVLAARDVEQALLADVTQWGAPVEVVVRRGVPHPFTSHPRLDLYVGSLSPHTTAVFGCTICHEGQGSATAFKYASHTPNSVGQEDGWREQHGWYDNHHWIYPMYPHRFAESACLKCHHDVVELEPSARFPEAPAPHVTAGYNLVRRYGCFGCHEINGYKTATERIGPDMRLEPNYFAAAAQTVADPGFSALAPEQQELARSLVHHPEDDAARRQLRDYLLQDAKSGSPSLSPATHKLEAVLADIENPGTLRKVGPSLRHVAAKLGPSFLYDWIQNPEHFRPSTRMPRFFGQWAHLQEDERQLAEAYEPIEILGITTYLLDRSQPYEKQDAPAAALSAGNAEAVERGRVAFETRGCLACHEHQAFAGANHGQYPQKLPAGLERNRQGPDLTNVGDKLGLKDSPDGAAWLYSWLRNPSGYHPRTKMPSLLYSSNYTDAEGHEVDPAADIAAFLLASKAGWLPTEVPLVPNVEHLDALAYEYLSKTFFMEDARKYLKTGVPQELAPTLKGAEIELVGDGDLQHRKLMYVGRKAIVKHGCFACHDVPGFEDAKPIGTGLADWGRKDASKLAFEHIADYVAHGNGHGGGQDHSAAAGSGHAASPDAAATADGRPEGQPIGESPSMTAEPAGDFDEEFYLHHLASQDRTGFIWQKLKEPRSYDFMKARNKDYNERLRMPHFPLTNEQREQMITFVLGLVAEPPAYEFVYHPEGRRQAIIEGQKVVTDYNCAACHVLDAAEWNIAFKPGDIAPPQIPPTYPFVETHFSESTLTASATPDPVRGTLSATLKGLPSITNEDARPMIFDEEGFPLEEGQKYDPAKLQYMFDLWVPTAIDGKTYEVGPQPLGVMAGMIKEQFPPHGGDLSFRLLPRVLEIEKQTTPAAKGREAWGWVAPPLIGEGKKVQPEWLHAFLLDPHVIRPAAFLRMPKFNMSPQEASAIVNYFAAKDDADYPYQFIPRTRPEHLAEKESEYRERAGTKDPDEAHSSGSVRLDAAMNIVTSGDYCIQCHLVADFRPKGSPRALAPDLSHVYERLRADYVRHWVANPPNILPYTGMPVNIPFVANAENLGGIKQELFRGTSLQQLDGLVDLLMNYNRYTSGRSVISPLIKLATPAATAGSSPAANPVAVIDHE